MSVLEVRDLAVRYTTRGGTTQALDGASLSLERGEVVAVVGESGSGKSTLGLAVLGLLPGNAARERGQLLIDGQDVFSLSGAELRRLRRDRLGLILQDAAGSLDPTQRIETQVA